MASTGECTKLLRHQPPAIRFSASHSVRSTKLSNTLRQDINVLITGKKDNFSERKLYLRTKTLKLRTFGRKGIQSCIRDCRSQGRNYKSLGTIPRVSWISMYFYLLKTKRYATINCIFEQNCEIWHTTCEKKYINDISFHCFLEKILKSNFRYDVAMVKWK